MNALWLKEWWEFGRQLPLRLSLPLILAAPFLYGEALRLPAVAVVLAWAGLYTTAAQLARERASGLLSRFRLTPVSPGTLVIHRILCRSCLVLLQTAPVLLLARWLGTPAGQIWLALPLIPLACAAGTVVGLRATSRRAAQLVGLGALAGAFAAGFGVTAATPARMGVGTPAYTAAALSPLPPLSAPLTAAALWVLAGAAVAAAATAAPRLFVENTD